MAKQLVVSVLQFVLCLVALSFCRVSAEVHAPAILLDENNRVQMGIANRLCDDGKRNLDMDWDGSPVNYTCFSPKAPIQIQDIAEIKECHVPPSTYMPAHFCMNQSISYNESIPTFGDHRPLWPVFGEYRFVPVQRWLHTLEHGGIVLLYDPCAHPHMVNRLRGLVTSCIRKHVITPYDKLPRDRPLALVSWGCKLLMNTVNYDTVISFIKETAMHGPEGSLSKQGQYRKQLLRTAHAPDGSDSEDVKLCPRFDNNL